MAIDAAAEIILKSTLYLANGKNGLIIAQGRHALIDPILCAAADIVMGLDQEDLDVCMRQYLDARGRWHLPADAVDEEINIMLRAEEANRDNRLLGKFAHYDKSAEEQKSRATVQVEVGIRPLQRIVTAALTYAAPFSS